jgi:hypothetical protein
LTRSDVERVAFERDAADARQAFDAAKIGTADPDSPPQSGRDPPQPSNIHRATGPMPATEVNILSDGDADPRAAERHRDRAIALRPITAIDSLEADVGQSLPR